MKGIYSGGFAPYMPTVLALHCCKLTKGKGVYGAPSADHKLRRLLKSSNACSRYAVKIRVLQRLGFDLDRVQGRKLLGNLWLFSCHTIKNHSVLFGGVHFLCSQATCNWARMRIYDGSSDLWSSMLIKCQVVHSTRFATLSQPL